MNGIGKLASHGARTHMLGRLRVFAEFSARTNSGAALRDAIQETCAPFGISCFSLVWHVPRIKELSEEYGLATYPSEWIETVRERDLMAHEPVVAACQQTVSGFHWSDVPSLIALSREQRETFALASRHGLERGYTVPFHVPGQLSGSCSFAFGCDGELPIAFEIAAPWISATAFEALRRIVSSAGVPRERPLSQRQADCVTWLCRGKSYRDIGTILGISEETVRTHVKIVMRKWDVTSRVQLVARALQSGIVTYGSLH